MSTKRKKLAIRTIAMSVFIGSLWCGGCDGIVPPLPDGRLTGIPIDTNRPNGKKQHDISWLRGFAHGMKGEARQDDPSWWCMERTSYAEGYRVGTCGKTFWYWQPGLNETFEQSLQRHRERLKTADPETIAQLWIADESGNMTEWHEWCDVNDVTPKVPECFSLGDIPLNCRAIYSVMKPSL